LKTKQVRPQQHLLGGEGAVEGDRISPLLLLLLLLLFKTSRLSWLQLQLQGHSTTVTKALERVDISDCKTAQKGESSDSSIPLLNAAVIVLRMSAVYVHQIVVDDAAGGFTRICLFCHRNLTARSRGKCRSCLTVLTRCCMRTEQRVPVLLRSAVNAASGRRGSLT